MSCLRSLPRSGVIPVVVANGCNDNTAKVAREYGVTTYDLEEPSKLGAIQHALRRHAKPGGPFMILDADSRIAFPNQFVDGVFKKTAKKKCVVLNGILAYSPEGAADKVAYIPTLARLAYVIKTASVDRLAIVTGQAQIIKPNEMAFDAILGLPSHIWPGEDIALVDIIYKSDGCSRISLDLRLTVVTNRRGMGRLVDRVFRSKEWHEDRAEWWGSRANSDSLSYAEYLYKIHEKVFPNLAQKIAYMPIRSELRDD